MRLLSDVDSDLQVFALGGPQTQQQQIDALLDEISDEVELDLRTAAGNPALDIQDRLNCLKTDGNTADHSGRCAANCSVVCCECMLLYSVVLFISFF